MALPRQVMGIQCVGGVYKGFIRACKGFTRVTWTTCIWNFCWWLLVQAWVWPVLCHHLQAACTLDDTWQGHSVLLSAWVLERGCSRKVAGKQCKSLVWCDGLLIETFIMTVEMSLYPSIVFWVATGMARIHRVLRSKTFKGVMCMSWLWCLSSSTRGFNP